MSDDRTEDPTQKKIDKSREEGQVPRSREMGSAVLLMGAGFILKSYGGVMVDTLIEVLHYNLALERESIFDPEYMLKHLAATGFKAFLMVLPIPLILMMVSIVTNIMTGGFIFQTSLLFPKFSRLNPMQWFSRLFSMQGLVELIKSILKVVLVSGCMVLVLRQHYALSLSLASMPINAAMAAGVSVLGGSLVYFGGALLVIGLIDAPYQIWSNKQKLKMTKQEIKDEYKEMDGKPEVKGRIRQLQREMAMQRMMQSVPESDVIITNPTHYAVALRYDTTRAAAPFVCAKGIDQVALKIRELAKDTKRPMVEAAPLARAVYHSTKVDQEIPMDLYLAVAQVLAYVQQLTMYRQGRGGDKPPTMAKFDIPKEYDDLEHQELDEDEWDDPGAE